MGVKRETYQKYIKLRSFYDLPKIFKFIEILRKSGIINMYAAPPFLYMGKKMIEHEYTYKEIPDEEAFEELLEQADEIKQSLIYGAYKQVHAQEDILGDDQHIRSVERKIQKDARDIFMIWMEMKGQIIKENIIKKMIKEIYIKNIKKI